MPFSAEASWERTKHLTAFPPNLEDYYKGILADYELIFNTAEKAKAKGAQLSGEGALKRESDFGCVPVDLARGREISLVTLLLKTFIAIRPTQLWLREDRGWLRERQ